MTRSLRVFISYSHDSKMHDANVLALAKRLREDGVDAWLDLYEDGPASGWPRWMQHQMEQADQVLLVCTPTYRNRVEARTSTGEGRGAIWEGNLIYQYLYEAGAISTKFIPVLPEDGKIEDIPAPIRGQQYYWPFSEDGYHDLYRRLTKQPAVSAPVLGPIKTFGPAATQPSLAKTIKYSISCSSSSMAVILLSDDKTFTFAPVIESEWNDREAKLILQPEPDNHEAPVFLDALRGRRVEVCVAYKSNAAIALVTQVNQSTKDGADRWSINLSLVRSDFLNSMEFTFNKLTPDAAAAIRAKRILLNEARSSKTNEYGDAMLEAVIAGQGTVVSVKESPFPHFFNDPKMRTQENLEAAWIFVVLQLKLSAAVEQVSRLELTIRDNSIDVLFSGRRKKIYTNQPAPIIEFKGTCGLN